MMKFLRWLFSGGCSVGSDVNEEKLRQAAEAAKRRGNDHFVLGEFDQAVECYQEALKFFPAYAEAYVNLGCVCLEQKRYIEARSFFGKAIEFDPKLWKAHFNLGKVAEKLDMPDQAIACYERVLRMQPPYTETHPWPEVHWCLMEVFDEEERYEDALQVVDAILRVHSEWVEALCNKGVILNKLGQNEEAIKQLEHVVAMKEHFLLLRFLGNFYQSAQDWKRAMQCYTRSYELNPLDLEALMNRALLLLLLGNYSEGWSLYEQALPGVHTKDVPVTDAHEFREKCKPEKYWDGDDLYGKTLLIWTEQGIGDSLMMFRYLPILKERYRAEKIFVICERSLVRMIRGFTEVDEVMVKPGCDVHTLVFDYHCSMLSLPFLTKTQIDTIPSSVPYIVVPKENQSTWAERLAVLPGLKVGLAWGGNKKLLFDKQRSIPLKKFAPFLELTGITWVSLQKGEPAFQLKELAWPIIDWTEELQDMQDTAALMEHLDLVISVDTSIIHLAGALGRPTWLLNRYGSEWRWLLECEYSPWYPTVRIFRQTVPNDWDSVIARMVTELKGLTHRP